MGVSTLLSILALVLAFAALLVAGFLLYRYMRMREAVGKFTRMLIDVGSRAFDELSSAESSPAARQAMRNSIQCVQTNMDKAVFYDRRTNDVIPVMEIPKLLDDLEAGNLRVRFHPKCEDNLDQNQKMILDDANILANNLLAGIGALASSK